jgi:carbon monoxide dehydrogenase subunit G
LKISGTSSVPAPQERAYALLQDPAVLARCMPGCEGLDPVGEGEYAMRLKMAIASMSGLFQGKVRVTDQNPQTSFRLIVEGTGKIGFMKGDGVITLTANSPHTVVHFEGEVQVGGTIASVGQRLIETTAKMLIKRFFDRLSAEAAAALQT